MYKSSSDQHTMDWLLELMTELDLFISYLLIKIWFILKEFI